MGKDDILKKLTSKKLWVTLSSNVALFLTALNVSENTVLQVTSFIGMAGITIGYLFAEAFVDGKRAEVDREFIEALSELGEDEADTEEVML